MCSVHLSDEEIDDYALGRTPAKDSARVEKHVLGCERCRREFEVVALMIVGLRDARQSALLSGRHNGGARKPDRE